VLGVIDAALERKEVAWREGRRAVELLPAEKDAVDGKLLVMYFAIMAAWVGEKISPANNSLWLPVHLVPPLAMAH
jgi:hypothetical protein